MSSGESTASPNPASLLDQTDFGVGAIEVADLVLAGVAKGRSKAIRFLPGDEETRIVGESVTESKLIARVPPGLGELAIARLSLIASLDPGISGPRAKVFKVNVEGQQVQVSLEVGRAGGRRIAEVRRITGAQAGPDGKLSRVGRYDLEGEERVGPVYVSQSGTHRETKRRVEVRTLRTDLARIPQVASRFVQEPRTVAHSQHQSLLELVDFGTLSDGRPFTVHESTADTRSLATLLQSGFVPTKTAVVIARQVAATLDAAHRRGVVHRDLTPASILLGAGDRVKLTDFGVPKVIAKDTENTVLAPAHRELFDRGADIVLGTVSYMPAESTGPEESGLDPTTDLYALACIFFEMVSGQAPYRAGSYAELAEMHANSPIPEIKSPEVEKLPIHFRDIVTRALAKKSSHRYDSASDLEVDLVCAQEALSRAGGPT